jgi:type IX secretion system PorP/SprF family membrane protein
MKTFYTILLILCCELVYAQDPLFSQSYTNRMYLNPAFVGNDNGYRGTIGHREQWIAVPSRFSTTAIGIEGSMPFLGAGAGLLLTRNTEGAGFLSTTGAGVQFSKVIGLKDWPDEKLFLYFGGSASIFYKSINWNKLVFGDQLDAVQGNVRPTLANAPSAENKYYPDFDFGTLLKYRRKLLSHTFGIAAHHLARPDDSFYGSNEQNLPRKYTVHYIINFPASLVFPSASPDLYLGPGFIYQKQKTFQNLMFGSKISYHKLFSGLWYRSKHVSLNSKKMDGLIILAGTKLHLSPDWYLNFAYSYDLTLSGLNDRTAGSHEISLVVEYSAIASRAHKKYKNCRDFNTPGERSMPVFDW